MFERCWIGRQNAQNEIRVRDQLAYICIMAIDGSNRNSILILTLLVRAGILSLSAVSGAIR